MAILSDKVDFKTKIIARGKERYFIKKNWPIHEKDITSEMCMHLIIELSDT